MAGTPIVLIHGYWHGSWCWTPLIAELTERGRQAIALDMAGHGLNAVWPSSNFARPFDPAAFATELSPMAGVTRVMAMVIGRSPRGAARRARLRPA